MVKRHSDVRSYFGSSAVGRSLGYVSAPGFMSIIMATDQSSMPHAFAGRHLHGTVIFLLPCANMSALRQRLLMPGIRGKGGALTDDPAVATHCVISIPLESEACKRLLIKYCVPADCTLVPESFLLQSDSSRILWNAQHTRDRVANPEHAIVPTTDWYDPHLSEEAVSLAPTLFIGGGTTGEAAVCDQPPHMVLAQKYT